MAAGVVFVRLLGSGVINFLRAQQRSGTVAMAQTIARGVNLALNVTLIPVLGIVGAALVTILSYAVFAVGVTRAAFRHVRFTVTLRGPSIMAALSVLVYVPLARLDTGSDVVDLFAKGSLALLPLALALFAADVQLRRWLQAQLARHRSERRPKPVE